ncbi:Glutathione S-transferase U1 [Xylographa pallens]|nr:Glutathione S-transferase U1 [Xylographa pallens]
MEEPTQQAFAQSRQNLNPFSAFHNSQAQPSAVPFASLDPHLQDLDSGEVFAQHFRSQLADPGHNQHLRDEDPFNRNVVPRFQEVRSHATPPPTGQFGILTPHARLPRNAQRPRNAYLHHNALDRIQRDHSEVQLAHSADAARKKDGHFDNAKSIPNPPNLHAWRERLFDVDETITLSEDDFLTYFPHVDNIYSHRSTQRYKRKPFLSHYWDCRLKGRPPGTPKSDDPTKRKRKRQARERDLCDVKIKITEYFPGARAILGQEFNGSAEEQSGGSIRQGGQVEHLPSRLQGSQQAGGFAVMAPMNENIPSLPGSNGERFFTIQRVNGNGGNGKGDGVAGPHKHTLQESDRVKKNSVQRQLLKQEKETKKMQLEDLNAGEPLLPQGDPKKRAHSRLWADHINRKIVPAFYHYLQAQEPAKQIESAEDLKTHIATLVDAADSTGPFFLGSTMSFVDVQIAPWLLRLGRVLKPYRGWPDAVEGTRFAKWVNAVENNVDVRATTSTDELYLDSYERYAGKNDLALSTIAELQN